MRKTVSTGLIRWLAALAILANVAAYRVAHSMLHMSKPRNERTPRDVGLAYETHRFTSSSGLTLDAWYVPRPRPRGVAALFHGYGSTKSQLLAAAQGFHELGYAALLVDFRGAGASDGTRTTIGVEESSDVTAALRHARRLAGAKPVVLYGSSMGAVAVLKSVSEGADPAAIVIDAPFDTLLNAVGRRFEAMRMPPFPGARLLVFWGGVIGGFDGFAHSSLRYAEAVRCPALLQVGQADARVREGDARAVYDRLAGPKSWKTYAGAGHGVLAAKAADEWRETVSQFLKKEVAVR